MDIKKVYLISLLIMIGLFFLPSILTIGEPNVDGQQIWGFPFTFAEYGGETRTGVYSYFIPTPFFFDIMILLGTPFLVVYIYSRFRK